MKKILAVYFALLICTMSSLCATSLKVYNDGRGHSGRAQAKFVGTTKKYSFERFSAFRELELRRAGNVQFCEKLCKEENFLIRSALNEYDYEVNEIYEIYVYPANNTRDTGFLCVSLLVTGRDTYRCYAFYYSE